MSFPLPCLFPGLHACVAICAHRLSPGRCCCTQVAAKGRVHIFKYLTDEARRRHNERHNPHMGGDGVDLAWKPATPDDRRRSKYVCQRHCLARAARFCGRAWVVATVNTAADAHHCCPRCSTRNTMSSSTTQTARWTVPCRPSPWPSRHTRVPPTQCLPSMTPPSHFHFTPSVGLVYFLIPLPHTRPSPLLSDGLRTFLGAVDRLPVSG